MRSCGHSMSVMLSCGHAVMRLFNVGHSMSVIQCRSFNVGHAVMRLFNVGHSMSVMRSCGHAVIQCRLLQCRLLQCRLLQCRLLQCYNKGIYIESPSIMKKSKKGIFNFIFNFWRVF